MIRRCFTGMERRAPGMRRIRELKRPERMPIADLENEIEAFAAVSGRI